MEPREHALLDDRTWHHHQSFRGRTYDGDGKRVKKAETNRSTVTTTVYIGSHMEKVFVGGTVTKTVKYYSHEVGTGAKRIAMRSIPADGSDTLYYFFNDHLGGTSVVLNASTFSSSCLLSNGLVKIMFYNAYTWLRR